MVEPQRRRSDRAVARSERRRAETREAILDGAEAVFRRRGFHAARIEEIAAGSDVSVGSIYAHFPGKSGVFLALAERALGVFERYMSALDAPGLGPLQRVLVGGDAYLRFHLDHPGLFQFVAPRRDGEGGPSSDEDVETRIRNRTAALLDRFAAVIDDAIAAGEASPVDSRRLTIFLWGAWNGVVALSARPDGLRLDDAEVVETLEVGRRLLREGLGAPALRGEDGRIGDRVPLPRIDVSDLETATTL